MEDKNKISIEQKRSKNYDSQFDIAKEELKENLNNIGIENSVISEKEDRKLAEKELKLRKEEFIKTLKESKYKRKDIKLEQKELEQEALLHNRDLKMKVKELQEAARQYNRTFKSDSKFSKEELQQRKNEFRKTYKANKISDKRDTQFNDRQLEQMSKFHSSDKRQLEKDRKQQKYEFKKELQQQKRDNRLQRNIAKLERLAERTKQIRELRQRKKEIKSEEKQTREQIKGDIKQAKIHADALVEAAKETKTNNYDMGPIIALQERIRVESIKGSDISSSTLDEILDKLEKLSNEKLEQQQLNIANTNDQDIEFVDFKKHKKIFEILQYTKENKSSLLEDDKSGGGSLSQS